MKIVLWGLGYDFWNNTELIKNKYDVVGAIDSDIDKAHLSGFACLTPADLQNYDYDAVLVSTRRSFLEIYRNLKELGIDDSRIYSITSEIFEPRVVSDWEQSGRKLPPPDSYKREYLRRVARENKCNVFVETGTYLGGMIEAQINCFQEISSIELSEELYSAAREKFRGIKKVHLYNGDSGVLLSSVIDDCRIPNPKRVFWLDGHYSGGITARGSQDTPIISEIRQISSRCTSGIILIDDARCFKGEMCGDEAYPTIEELERECRECFDIRDWAVNDDIIMCVF